jgi:hypothetical protein
MKYYVMVEKNAGVFTRKFFSSWEAALMFAASHKIRKCQIKKV